MNESKFFAFINKYYVYIFSALLALLAFMCFFYLGSSQIKDFDEARHGINAFEMIYNNNYIANFYGGKVDYWNLKPPISYYFVILGYKIFGFNAWGLRFFSALSYFILVVIVSLFLKKHKGKLESLIATIFFITSWFFFYNHFVRTGDADALFILFAGIAIISLYLSSNNSNYLCLTAFMFALCFLTKSWHSFFILPITFFYLIFTKGFKKIKWWKYFTITLSCLIPLFIWGIFRYSFDGLKFFIEMINYDLLNRSANAIEGNRGFPLFYLAYLGINSMSLVCVVVMTVGFVYKARKKNLNNLDILCVTSFSCIYVIYIIAKTKLFWYTFPACTPLIIITSIYIADFLRNENIKNKLKKILSISFFVLITIEMTAFSYFVFFYTKTDYLQLFVKAMPYDKEVEVYYQDKDLDYLRQGAFLCFEWKTNTISKIGGYEEFKKATNANIIFPKSYYDSLNNPNLKIIYEEYGYVLCSM